MATSKAATTGRGGVSFDDLCGGHEKGYSFNLISLDGVTNVEQAVKMTFERITETLTALSGTHEIEKFYIGKTSTRKLLKYHAIDPMNKDTMIKDRINGTWSRHRLAKRDGMVIVTVVTEKVAKALNSKAVSEYTKRSAAENCALEIERKLQKKFKKHPLGPLLAHDERYSAGPPSKVSEAFPIYLAFEYLQQTAYSSYNFNLCDLSDAESLEAATAIINKRIDDICKDLKHCTGTDPTFFVGHTYVYKAKDYKELNLMDPSTFDKEGIQKRWDVRWTQSYYSKDGMTVVAVVTKEIATKLGCRDAKDCTHQIKERVSSKKHIKEEIAEDKRHDVGSCLYITFSYPQVQNKEAVYS